MSHPDKWTFPPAGFVKFSTDAALDSDNNTESVGLLAREAHGNVISSTDRILPYVFYVEANEAQAMLIGL